MIASKSDIIAYESLGFSHLVWRGESYFVNLDSDSSRLKFKNYLEKETGKEWDIADLGRCVFYRKDMYSLEIYSSDNNCLELKDTFRGKVEVPINAISCEYMFSRKSLEGIDFSDFDTSGIKDMCGMFEECIFPEGFSLGDEFNTANVTDMSGMFSICTFPEGFSLGDKFDTSSVKDMQFMFEECTFPEGFSLGDMFDTSSVKDMSNMFCRCNFPKVFSLGYQFDTSKVENMRFMFYECIFPEGFSLGDKFDTSSVEEMSNMFSYTQFNKDFTLAKNFTICKEARGMFANAKLPSRVTKQFGSEVTVKEIVELLKSA